MILATFAESREKGTIFFYDTYQIFMFTGIIHDFFK